MTSTQAVDGLSLIDDTDSGHLATVTVNDQKVVLAKRELTGLEIKQAAMEQGVHIQATFQLSLKRGKRYEVIGDTDSVRIHPHQEFICVAPDDNS